MALEIKWPPIGDLEFKGHKFSKPPANFDQLNPIDYFKMFWTDDITDGHNEATKL